MYRGFSVNLLIIIAVAFLDAVFIGSLPWGLHRLHLLPLALIFVLLLSNIRWTAWWTLAGGLILELFSFRWFGSYLLVLFLILVIIQLLLERVVTNRSIYSIVIISIIVTLTWDLIFLLFDFRAGVLIPSWLEVFRILGLSLVVNIVAAAIVFYAINVFSRRFKPVFLSIR